MRTYCNFLTPVSVNTLLYCLPLRGIGRSSEREISSSAPVPFLSKESSVVIRLLWLDNDYPVIYLSFCKINEILLSRGDDMDEFKLLESCSAEEANIGEHLGRKVYWLPCLCPGNTGIH